MDQNVREVLPYAVNFSIVVALLGFLLKKPVRKFVYQRHERMKDAFESASIAHAKALARNEQAKKALQKVADEESQLLAKELVTTNQEKSEILEKAKAEAARVQQEAERMASVEQEEASDRVKEEFLALVVRETEESLKKGLKKDDHTAILKRAQNSIEVGV